MSSQYFCIFQSGDGKNFQVSKKALSQSTFLTKLARELGDLPMIFDFIHSNDLVKFVEYLEFHVLCDDPDLELDAKPSPKQIAEFDLTIAKECTADNKSLMRFLVNTDKLGLDNFFELIGLQFSDRITGKTSEQLVEEFEVKNYTPLTEEQKHAIFETDDWLYPSLPPPDGQEDEANYQEQDQLDPDLQNQQNADVPSKQDDNLQAQQDHNLQDKQDQDLHIQQDQDLHVQQDQDLHIQPDPDLPPQQDPDMHTQQDRNLQDHLDQSQENLLDQNTLNKKVENEIQK